MTSTGKFPLWHRLVATSLGFGYSPWAPGTMGAVFGVLVWLVPYFCCSYATLMWITLALVVLFTLLGAWSGTVAERFWGPDPSRVVMDETVGVWITLMAVPPHGHWGYILGAFALFRFFDIAKPLGVRKMERFPGGWGIMADDILAGIYGALVLIVTQHIILLCNGQL